MGSNVNDESTPTVREGFPNPALDSAAVPLDLNQLVVKNPTSTFYMRIDSDSYEGLGIYKNDLVVIDRSLDPRPNDLAAVVSEGEFSLLVIGHQLTADTTLWGVITHVVHKKR